MQIRIAGKQIEIGRSLQERVRVKLAQAVAKYFDRAAEAHVTVSKERLGFKAECTVHLSSGAVMQAHGTGPNAGVAFDQALDRLSKQVRRYKRRIKNHHERGAERSAAAE